MMNVFRRTMTKDAFRDPRGTAFSMTKIVGTIGPVSENLETMQNVVNEGLRVMRINFSHATYEEATLRMDNMRKCQGVHSIYGQKFNLRSILLDTQGPEIRSGSIENDEKILLEKGQEITLTTDEKYKTSSTAEMLYVTYEKMPATVKSGDCVLLDDGLIRLTVIEVDEQAQTIRCLIQNTERLGSRKGVNLPGLNVDLPAMTEKDKQDIEFGIKNDMDFIAASFVRTAQDVTQIKDFVEKTQLKYWPASHPAPRIISKIENFQGVRNFSEILSVSDGIMVARGDLGVEIPLQKVLTCQKDMVSQCNAVGKPVIVATQMLESMIRNPRPTRAEVSDVGNAVLDGADAVMLSGEVAQGQYPVECVQTMMSIVKEADTLHQTKRWTFDSASSDVESIASSAVKVAHELNTQLIIVLTDTGFTAQMVAKYRPNVPVMCFASSQKIARQLQLHRGLFPIVSENTSSRPTPEEALKQAKDLGWVQDGDKVVILNAAEDLSSDHLGTQILLRIAEIRN